MAILNGVTTKESNLVWKSPDGERELYEVVFESQGQELKAKTYSSYIGTEGWSGDLLVEERQGKKGLETFVKQAPKEDGSYQARSGGGASGGANSRQPYVPKDDKAIQAMWAISQSIAAHSGTTDSDMNPADLASVEGYANELFSMVDRVKASQGTDTTSQPDVVVEDVDGGDLDLSLMDEVLGAKPQTVETPWGKTAPAQPAS